MDPWINYEHNFHMWCKYLPNINKALSYNYDLAISAWWIIHLQSGHQPSLLDIKKNQGYIDGKNRYLGAVSIRKTVLLGMAIPMLKIRRPTGRLIFNMGIPIPGKTVFYIETGPWQLLWNMINNICPNFTWNDMDEKLHPTVLLDVNTYPFPNPNQVLINLY